MKRKAHALADVNEIICDECNEFIGYIKNPNNTCYNCGKDLCNKHINTKIYNLCCSKCSSYTEGK